MDDMEMEYGPDILTLSDEDGVEYEFEVIDDADIDDEHYFALLPYNENGDDSEESEFIILKSQMDGDEEVLVPIEDEDELNSVYETFMNRLDDLYEFHEDHDDDCDCGCHHHDEEE